MFGAIWYKCNNPAGQDLKDSVRPSAASRTVGFAEPDAGAERAASASPPSALPGCRWRDVKSRLRDVGLRPARERRALGWILLGRGARHISAEMLYEGGT